MTRVHNFDGEIGRGRQRSEDDSSSSRESSPIRRERSFSPPSDDVDVIQQEKTHSSAEGPIIRQAVFPVKATQVPVMTYEAKVEQTKKKQFLPGQEVPSPAKQKGTKISKKTRKPDPYSTQTSKFRLDGYDPTPSTEPPTTHGNGPYSSLYRNVGYNKKPPPSPPPQAGPSNPIPVGALPSSSNSSSFPLNNSNFHVPPIGVGDVPSAVPPAPILRTVSAPSVQRLPKSSALASSWSNTPKAVPYPSPSSLSADGRPHSTVTDTSSTLREPSSPGLYYRRNYDDKDFPFPRDQQNMSRNMSTKQSTPDSCFFNQAQTVTLLLTDIRNEFEDHQLAEVKVLLKKDEKSAEEWADAKDIAEQLQSGASRIDGPARVYIMRGKYRQFVLRVTAENKDEIVSANVPVSARRTVELTVELLRPPGVNSRPVQSPGYGSSRPSDKSRNEVHSRGSVPSKRRASSSCSDVADHRSSTKVRRRDSGWEQSVRHQSRSPYRGQSYYNSHSNRESRSWRPRPSADSEEHRQPVSPEYRSFPFPSPPSMARGPLSSKHVGPGYSMREYDNDSSDSADESLGSKVSQFQKQSSLVNAGTSKAVAESEKNKTVNSAVVQE